jgi:hypothetical protein
MALGRSSTPGRAKTLRASSSTTSRSGFCSSCVCGLVGVVVGRDPLLFGKTLSFISYLHLLRFHRRRVWRFVNDQFRTLLPRSYKTFCPAVSPSFTPTLNPSVLASVSTRLRLLADVALRSSALLDRMDACVRQREA